MNYLIYLNPFIFHINLFELASMATLFTGLTLALLLLFAKRPGKTANLFLSLALVVIILKTDGLAPLLLPALGPLLYLYLRQLTAPDSRFRRKDALHFSLLITGYWIPAWLVLISVIIYLYLSHRLIQAFYSRLRPVLMDRPRFAFRHLDRILLLLGFFCMLSLFNNTFYFSVAFVLIGMASEAILKTGNDVQLAMPITDRSDAREKGRRLKETVAANRLYEDAELTLTTLAVKLMIHPHDLSRIINVGLEKNFSDFINEFRVREIARKMRDPEYDRLTLLGIAYESGFNSERTFHRVFKEMTGKTPLEYKNGLKKELPIYQLAALPRMRPVILHPESPPVWAPEKLKSNIMIRNYLKIAYRSLIRNGWLSIINIGGLAIGITCAGLIGLWIADELSFDGFNQNRDRLYAVEVNSSFGGNAFTMESTPRLLFSALKEEVPGIANACRVNDQGERMLFTMGDKKLYATGLHADPQFFQMFTVPFLQGNVHNPYPALYSIVLSEQTALRFFGTTRGVIGKIVRMNNTKDYVVTGVMKDMPANSTLQFDWLAPYQVLMQEQAEQSGQPDISWSSFGPLTYVQLSPGADVNDVNARIAGFIHGKDASQKASIFLFPMNKWRLYYNFANGKPSGSGRITQVRLMGAIAGIILLIACINFMNLATARSEKRSKEIGVRKVLGSGRHRLIWQFMVESVLLSAIASIVAVGLMALVLPAFNQLVQKHLDMGWLNPAHILAAVVLTLVCGLLAGSYPSAYLSSFDPVKVLKGLRIKTNGAAFVRQGLVVLQFGVSVVFIISTIVVYRQVQHVKNRNLGFDKDNLLEVDMQHNYNRDFQAFRQDLLRTGVVADAAMADYATLDGGNADNRYNWPGKDAKLNVGVSFRTVSPEFIGTSGMHLRTGHGFTGEPTDTSSVIVNRALAKIIDSNGVIGKIIQSPRGVPDGKFKNTRIIGVVDDYQFGPVYGAGTPPVILYCNPYQQPDQSLAYIRIKPGKVSQQTLAAIAAVVKKDDPDYPFQYKFVDEAFNEKFATEVQTSKLSGVFAMLAVIISCLGLFSLAAYTAERRLKEIGIRKVLGASVSGLAGLLSKDFLKLVMMSCLVAFPVAFWIMHSWLQGYDYRITLQWWIFALAGLAAVFIAIITVSFQAIKAALANPVKSLRSE